MIIFLSILTVAINLYCLNQLRRAGNKIHVLERSNEALKRENDGLTFVNSFWQNSYTDLFHANAEEHVYDTAVGFDARDGKFYLYCRCGKKKPAEAFAA